MINIRVIDENMNLLCEIDNCELLTFTRRFYNVGEFELKININKEHTDKLQKWNLIVLEKQFNKVGIILHREYGMDSNGENSETLYIKGLTLDGLTTFRRIVPSVGFGFVNFQGSQESIMKSLVDCCMVNTEDVDRKINQVSIATNQNRGIEDKWRARFDKLSDKLYEIGLYSKLGWSFTLDVKNKKFVFDVKQGKDLTVNQNTNAPVIFSIDFDNVFSRNYIESLLQSKNVLYAGGKGEGIDRLIQKVGTAKGFRRIEEFQDFSNAEDAVELITLGNQKLEELKEVQSFEARVLPNNSFILGKDYDLGDYVSIIDRKLGLKINTQIIEIKESYDDKGFNVDVVFGDRLISILERLKRREVIK